MAEPIGTFLGLDVDDAVELAELLAFVSDRLASDRNRLDASLHDYVGAPHHLGAAWRVDELRADVERY